MYVVIWVSFIRQMLPNVREHKRNERYALLVARRLESTQCDSQTDESDIGRIV
jgi:hypothetical protein